MQSYYKDSNSNLDHSDKPHRQNSSKKNGSSKKMSVLNSSFNSHKENKNDSFYRKNRKKNEDFADNFKVVIRVRPLMQREAINGIFVSAVDVSPDNRIINIYEYFNLELVEPDLVEEYIENPDNYQTHQFAFDHVYDENSSQEHLYHITAKQAVLSSLEGYNAS
jgi:hypothetical protein